MKVTWINLWSLISLFKDHIFIQRDLTDAEASNMSAGWWLLWDGILSCWVSRVCSFSLLLIQSRVMVGAEPITGLIGWEMGTPVQVSIHHRALCNYLISGYKSLINIFTDRALFHVPESDIWTLYSFSLCFSFSCWKRILAYLILCYVEGKLNLSP